MTQFLDACMRQEARPSLVLLNSLDSERCGNDFKSIIFKVVKDNSSLVTVKLLSHEDAKAPH